MEPNAEALSELDEYRFEAGGWLVLPAVLTAEELAFLNAQLGISGAQPQQHCALLLRALDDLAQNRSGVAQDCLAIAP